MQVDEVTTALKNMYPQADSISLENGTLRMMFGKRLLIGYYKIPLAKNDFDSIINSINENFTN